MLGKQVRKPCNEAICILDYVERKLNGEEVQEPDVKYHIHMNVLKYFKRLLESERQMSEAAKKMLTLTAALSSFDVNMSHSSYRLIDFAREMSMLSESNLAIVEQTTASMNQVNETVADTSETLEQLSKASEILVERNNQSLQQIEEVNELKNDVMDDADIMSRQIQQLVEMASKVNDIVNNVKAIADQTNLLALNASIEAARAGEHGRGFSVVAQEIRKLADDTKKSLEGMNEFVSNIQSAALSGKQSMENTLNSTSEMSKKLEAITGTIKENVDMLNLTIKDIKVINESMEGIKSASNEINQAMEASSVDAEKLSHMTQTIAADAEQSAEYAKQISGIDDSLSSIVRDMMKVLQGSKNAIGNQELLQNLDTAKTAHKTWMSNLKRIVDEMRTYPIQVNSSKCAFGHFYNSISIEHPEIKEAWGSIDGIHKELHDYGQKVIDAVKKKDQTSALECYNKAEELSLQVLSHLDRVISLIEEQDKKGVQILRGTE